MRLVKPRTIMAKRCGALKGGGGREEERFPWNFGGTRKICHNWWRSKGFQSIVKLFLTFLKVKHCREGG